MDEATVRAVRARAKGRCEYCQLSDVHELMAFEIEHIVAVKHFGESDLSNLAYACVSCNRHKGSNLSGIDRATSRTKLVSLFHPRRHKWHSHFLRDGPVIRGKTPIGRVTIYVLNMNSEQLILMRTVLAEEQRLR